MFKILHRYIASSVLSSAAAAIVFIGFIFGAVNLLKDVLVYLLDGRIPFGLFLKLCWDMAQYVGTYAVPIGMLIGVLLVLGRMSADNEITAMRTSGRSILQIARPILVIALFGVVAELGINFYLMPKSRVSYHVELEKALRHSAANFFVPRTFMREIPGAVIFFDKKDGQTYQNLWVWLLDNQQRATYIYHAASAVIEFDLDREILRVLPFEGNIEARAAADPEKRADHNNILQMGGTEQAVEIPLGDFLGKRGFRQKLNWLTLPELLERRTELAHDPKATDIDRLKVTLTIHNKLTFSLGVFSFALIAIPLGIRTQRKESSANIGIAMLLVVVYYVMSVAVGWLDKRPDLHPEILIWLPNAVFIGTGLILLRRVERT
ncbi:lipopolysaccharide export system permease protein [Ereboglobus sp. PH5-10]|uniref:LptF/LptG family permease n=1 Tax=Ereboglobus sp. PH5-10 TaxID=2940629 RepID=UPI002406150A|nr:LptF/LptG family permease [Ereboglobus sp. PH5-10]MDF9827524.1 lipopolysaccharide export system permease protein [Ereboglobus sp. PH5-10]